jgi:hypothetical protein
LLQRHFVRRAGTVGLIRPIELVQPADWSASSDNFPPANAGVRDEFRLNPFPPAGGNGSATLPKPTPVPQAKT